MAQMRKKPAKRRKRRGTVIPNRDPAGIGWVCCACFSVVLILCILNRSERITCIIVGACILMTVPLMMTRNIRIDYHEDKGFVYHNLLGVRRRYRWEDITYVRRAKPFGQRKQRKSQPHDTVIELGKAQIRVGWDAYNSDDFLNLAWKHYKERKKLYAADRGQSIPEG